MKALSIGKAAAVASTALLMGAYVWHQARQGTPEAIGDPAATARANTQPAEGQVEFTTIPGIPINPDVETGNIQTFPGSKSAMVFPGSKSDTVVPFPLPGSKSGIVNIPVPGTDSTVPPTVLPGSKSLPMILDEESLQRILEEDKESGESEGAPKPVLPGSKVKVPIVPPRPIPIPSDSDQESGDDQPAEESAQK